MLVCAPSDAQLSQFHEVTTHAFRLLLKLTKERPPTQTKLAITVILHDQTQTAEVPTRVAEIACGHPSESTSDAAFQLLHNVFAQNTQLGLALAASLSKPLRAARRGTWQDGLKLILRTLSFSIPSKNELSGQGARGQPEMQKFKKYSDYAQVCSHVRRAEADRELAVPEFEIGPGAAQLIVREVLEGPRYAAASLLLSRIVVH